MDFAVKASCKMTILMLLLVFVLGCISYTSAYRIGVNYGMMANNLPAPADVINLYKRSGIQMLRLFDPNHGALQALRGSGLEVTLGVSNGDIPRLAANQQAANEWIATNVKPFNDVSIKYITLGNEMVPSATSHDIAQAIRNIHNAVVAAGLGRIKVTTVVDARVLGNSYPPSAGAFSKAALNDMTAILAVIAQIGAPLMANIYPYFAYAYNSGQISLDYAMFNAKSHPVRDGNLQYWSLFDAILDAFYSAMERVGKGGVSIIVTETGWPSAGNGKFTTPDLAKTYNNNLIKHVNTNGTPKRPHNPIETYIFAMFNENLKPAGVEQNWGLFYPNMQPVYPVFIRSDNAITVSNETQANDDCFSPATDGSDDNF